MAETATGQIQIPRNAPSADIMYNYWINFTYMWKNTTGFAIIHEWGGGGGTGVPLYLIFGFFLHLIDSFFYIQV